MIAGEKAPDFTLYDHTGRPRSLSAFLQDGPVVLFFFPIASSPICTAQACHFRDLSDEFAAVGAQRVGISTDTVDRQAHFAQQRSFDYPLLSDAACSVADQFGIRRGGWLMRKKREREIKRGKSHAAKRGYIKQLLSVKRTTFVIDRDRVVRLVVTSERAHVHADKSLDYLRYLS